jgi:iron complex outermembrane recepter protein
MQRSSLLSGCVRAVLALAVAQGSFVSLAHADDSDSEKLDTVTVEADRLHVLPTEPVESVFGFGKNILETPRAVTSISKEMLDKTLITEIDDLVAVTPGSFTQSFFGVAGSLDVRGTPGENYFRGIKRIDNPGNYPTAIGASDRIDIVRGPASPIYGPSKIGGYLNFVPKSARASGGQFLTENEGEIGVTTGSWNAKNLHAEIGGPAKFFDKPMGFYLYTEFENSGSYYENSSTKQSIYQASFDVDWSDSVRLEFGGMYQDFDGNQVAGWNRLTQDLIDHGTYITGSPVSLDTNHDGLLSNQESANGNISAFIFGPSIQTPAQIAAALAAHPNMALVNPGTTHIKGSDVLVQEDDVLGDQVLTLYFDTTFTPSEGLKMVNKYFFESLNNINENAYGFSQYAKTYAMEDQFIVSLDANWSDAAKAKFQFSPSIRYSGFEHGDDFTYEYFDRRDITQIGSPIDRRTLATRGQDPYTDHTHGHFIDYGIAALADFTFIDHLHVLAGARYDSVDMTSAQYNDTTSDLAGQKVTDTEDGTSWSGSISYDLPGGFIPYITRAKQTTLILGQGGQIDTQQVIDGTALADSKLTEYGLKASLLGGQLYAAVDYFDQERVDLNAQDTVTNNTTEAKGWEFETRWVVNKIVTITGAYTNLKIVNLTATQSGTQFSFAGAGDLQGVDPSLAYGGVIPSIVLVDGDAKKAGIPENLYSLYGLFSFTGAWSGLTASVGLTHVDSVPSGFSETIMLPAYTLVNAGLHYETGKWKVGIQGKNLTNEHYFRSNFPDLFGSSVVLPELPRNWLASLDFKF